MSKQKPIFIQISIKIVAIIAITLVIESLILRDANKILWFIEREIALLRRDIV